MSDEPARADGPTEVVETESGELVERLSGGTATLLLVWLIGVGALSTLLAAWAYVWIVSGERLGIGALFGGFGLYTALAGAAGPCVLWLAGRAQGHGLGWFMLTAAKIALVMVAISCWSSSSAHRGDHERRGAGPASPSRSRGCWPWSAWTLGQVWALATWAADRWIAKARVTE